MSQVSFGSARAVNPEAGDHAVSADPEERSAAEAAIRASWREFPYYAQRYGERGWRFSLSDTGWLQTLCQGREADARSQVRWLSEVLAARGMPSYLLERHLILLHTQLLQVMPEREPQYATLLACSGSLRERREACISTVQFFELSASFEEAVKTSGRRIGNMGAVIVAAVADESAGVSGASSVESWVCDESRFDSVWVDAAQSVLRTARALARGGSVP